MQVLYDEKTQQVLKNISMKIEAERQELKDLFTSYWQYLAVKTACKLDLFDHLETSSTIDDLRKSLNVEITALSFLIDGLITLGFINKKNGKLFLTQKGAFLTEEHPKTLKYACILWGEEHLTAWQELEHTIKTGQPSFEFCFHKPFFEWLSTEEEASEIYHKAMFEYARDDYEFITDIIDFSSHNILMDVGGGLGALLMAVRKKMPVMSMYLLETEPVLKLLPRNYSNLFSAISGDFFKEIPALADAITMSRVIHDWNDEKAHIILTNAYQALPSGGTLYLIEIIKENLKDGAALLNLNMQLICNSYERTLEEYKVLLQGVRFKIMNTKSLNTLQSIIICKK